MDKFFHICTIANKLEQYEEMKISFIEAGFDENRCRYSLFDNSRGNIYDPYETLNKLLLTTIEPYIIFCHQDVLLNQGHGFNQLVKVLEELEKLDPKWAVTGNAGFNNNYELVAKITDPSTPNWLGTFPQKVHSLDENFLVIKISAKITYFQEKLDGFHFYATDLCLNAILSGYSCYVIDFHLTHLSAGNFNQAFYEAQERFYKKWSKEFNFCYVKTTCSPMLFLSKHKILQYIGSRNKVIKLFLTHRYLHPLVTLY
ncbi:MAG: glycosyltransferase family 2 protein [Hassallia sp.]